jgi:hypothetical protein
MKEGPSFEPSSPKLCTCQGQICITLAHQSPFQNLHFQLCVDRTWGLQNYHLISRLKMDNCAQKEEERTLKPNSPMWDTCQCQSLLPWLSKLCFKIGRYQTCMASAWVIMWQYCSQHVWEKTPSIERSCLVATLSHLDQFCKQSTSKEGVWP